MRKALSVILLCLALCAFAQRRVVNWHHSLSPYRAVFNVKPGGNPRAGALLEVPICGTGAEDGSGVFCYSESGKSLPCRYLGIGIQNCALVQVLPDKEGSVLAYFGSGQHTPVANFELPPALCQVYSIKGKAKNWEELSAWLTPSALLGQMPAEEFVRVGNPIDSRDEFAVVFSAKLNIGGDCSKNLFVASDDAGYLLIDGKLVVARDGVHGVWDSLRGENHKLVELNKGYHDIKLVGANYGKDFVVAVGEWFPSKPVVHLPKTIYVQPARTELLAIEPHRKDAPIPMFKYKHLADMPLGDRHLTITEFKTYDGNEVDWSFADGLQLSGAKVTRAFGSLETMQVKVRAGRSTAGGSVMFPQLAPSRVETSKKQSAFDEFDSLISKEMIAGSTADALYALMEFYGRRDLHPKQMFVAEAVLVKNGVPEERKFDALLMLARSAALENPDRALKAYKSVLQSPHLKRARFAGMVCEAFEFALFGMRDFELADNMLRRSYQRLKRDTRVLVGMEFDLALQQGKLEEASRLYQELLSFRTDSTEIRTAAVRGTSIQAKVSMMLSQGKVFDAEEAMRDWIAASPQDRANGSFSLARARCFRRRGWNKGAVGELTAAIQADPLLPNLPDVEFELALAYNDLGDKEKATELFKKISKDYPNHRLAGEALKRLGQ